MDFWGFERRFSDFPGERFGLLDVSGGAGIGAGGKVEFTPEFWQKSQANHDNIKKFLADVAGKYHLEDELPDEDEINDPDELNDFLDEALDKIGDPAERDRVSTEAKALISERRKIEELKERRDDANGGFLDLEEDGLYKEAVKSGERQFVSGAGDVSPPPPGAGSVPPGTPSTPGGGDLFATKKRVSGELRKNVKDLGDLLGVPYDPGPDTANPDYSKARLEAWLGGAPVTDKLKELKAKADLGDDSQYKRATGLFGKVRDGIEARGEIEEGLGIFEKDKPTDDESTRFAEIASKYGASTSPAASTPPPAGTTPPPGGGQLGPASTGNSDLDKINQMTATAHGLGNLAGAMGYGINQGAGAMGIPGAFSTSVNYPGGAFGYSYNRGGFPGGGPFVQTGSFSQPGVGFGGGGPGFGFGGFDLLFDIGPAFRSGNLTDDIKRDNRRLEALIAFLMAQILAGNTDAITTALIVISRKSKGTLILSAHAMMTAMQQYDKQQEVLTEKFKQLDPGSKEFQGDSQKLSLELNSIATSRQMLMNQLRDVMTMSEEIGNVEKSILDITGQFKRHYSRFNV